jgi:solute carrier family 25 oxoglutarate transporter 11
MSSPQLDATPSVFGPGQAHGSSRELIKKRGDAGVAKTGHAWKSFAAGSAAAMVSGAVTHPIDLVKVRLQLASGSSTPSMMGTAAAVIRHEGAAALYKGLSASLLRQATFIGTKFGSYDVLKSTCSSLNGGEPCMSFASKVGFFLSFTRRSARLGPVAALTSHAVRSAARRRKVSHAGRWAMRWVLWMVQVVCGFGAGALGAAVGNPADLAMVRMQVRVKRTLTPLSLQ